MNLCLPLALTDKFLKFDYKATNKARVAKTLKTALLVELDSSAIGWLVAAWF